VPHEGQGASRRSLALERRAAAVQVTHCKGSKCGQRASVPGAHLALEARKLGRHIPQARSGNPHACYNLSRSVKKAEFHVKEHSSELERQFEPRGNTVGVRMFFEHGRPTVFEPCKLASRDSARKQFRRRRLQPRLGGHLALIELLQPLAPPGELDRAKRRLGGVRDDIGHRIVDIEQGIESGPQLDGPIEPDEIAVARFSDR
jgi:hypothetical protein